MASPSVTYAFINGQASDGPQVSQNFTDLISALTDGTKDLVINALTLNGAFIAKGTVQLGDSTSDTIDVQGRFINNLIPSTSASRDLGTTLLLWNAAYITTGNITTGNITTLNVTGTTTLATSLTGVVKAVSGVISAATLVNADVSSSAAIAGTKISPDFGSQNVVTTGTGTFTTLAQTGNQINLDSDATGAQLVGLKTGSNTNQLYLTANTAAGNGGEIACYGSTHATKASQVQIANAGSFTITIDSSGNFFALLGNIVASTAGKGLQIKEGSNARMGNSTLSGGTVVVSNSSVGASTRIFLSRATTGGTAGHLSYTRSAGTSFTINSSSGTDTSTIDWLLVEPS